MIKGERKWFRSVKLGMWIGVRDGILSIEPEMKKSDDLKILVKAGGTKEKGTVAKELCKKLAWDQDELLQILPSGNARVQ